ncbi:MAG: hypothetical protein HYS15_02615 [Candidatus Spechtbacteria bacterium]|nr:hypothetical protein [Candidatus Spechtbacteria bacterium]
MRDAIENFPAQFSYKPEIVNFQNLKRRGIFIVAGMGGSHLGADIIQAYDPSLDIMVRSDYGLSSYPKSVLQNCLVIANSYSGDTEETIDVFKEAGDRGLPVAAITKGGELIQLAKTLGAPYIELPPAALQPRSALGYSVRAMLLMIGHTQGLEETGALASALSALQFTEQGRKLAGILKGKVPVIYSSDRNYAIAYNWKAKFNETGKIPAFFNVFPELNHNEMTGYDVLDSTKELSRNFFFLFLNDAEDDPRVQKRMSLTKKLLQNRGLSCESIELEGDSRFYRIFSSLLVADWIAYYTAELYGADSEQVPMVEEFKKLMAN